MRHLTTCARLIRLRLPRTLGLATGLCYPKNGSPVRCISTGCKLPMKPSSSGFQASTDGCGSRKQPFCPSRAPRRWPLSRACLSQTPTFEPPMSSWWRVYRLAGLAAVSLSTADKEFRPVVTVYPQHVPSLVIGVMSGHFSEPAPEQPASLRHGGLSYLTRSTSLHEVIQSARNSGFRR